MKVILGYIESRIQPRLLEILSKKKKVREGGREEYGREGKRREEEEEERGKKKRERGGKRKSSISRYIQTNYIWDNKTPRTFYVPRP